MGLSLHTDVIFKNINVKHFCKQQVQINCSNLKIKMIFTGKIINKQCTYSNSLINTRHDVEQAYSYSTKLFRGPDTTASPLWYEYGTTFKFYLTTIAKVG